MASTFGKKVSDFTSVKTLRGHLDTGEIGRCYVFYGEEVYMRDKMFRELEQQVVPTGVEAFNYHAFDGGEMSVAQLEDVVNCFPMMATKSFVVVRDWDIFKLGEKQREELVEVLKNLPDYCVLVFFFHQVSYNSRVKMGNSLRELALVVEFPCLEQRELAQWIQDYFQSLGKGISLPVAEDLIFYCGDHMTKLSSEIEKIAPFAMGEQIEKEDIYGVAMPHLDAISFELSDALGNQQYEKALGVLADLYQMEEEPLSILGAVTRQLRLIYGAKLAMESGKGESFVADMCQIKAYPAKLSIQSARRVSLPWCRNASLLCARTERRMKLTSERKELLVQLLLELSLGERN